MPLAYCCRNSVRHGVPRLNGSVCRHYVVLTFASHKKSYDSSFGGQNSQFRVQGFTLNEGVKICTHTFDRHEKSVTESDLGGLDGPIVVITG